MKAGSPISPHDYVRVDSLPVWQQEAFATWIYWQTCPVVSHERDLDGKPARCAYRWDYEHWLAAAARDEIILPLD